MISKSGAIAQLGERVLCKHEVVGSIPIGSTILRCYAASDGRPLASISEGCLPKLRQERRETVQS